MKEPDFHVLNWEFCPKSDNNIYHTFLSGTYSTNGKEITFKNALLVCVAKKDGETIFSVIVSEMDNNSIDVYGSNFSGSITERMYEYLGDDPHSCDILHHKGGHTVKWNPETQQVEELNNKPRLTREEIEAEWRRQFRHGKFPDRRLYDKT